MDEQGVPSKDLSKSIGEHPGNVVRVVNVYSYRSISRMTVALMLAPAEDIQPWRAVRAELVGPGRRTLRVKPPWQPEPISSTAKNALVVIEAEATEAEIRGTFTLKVWDADGTRSIVITGVTFP
jgi:uncharacterized protein (TIGR02268 family)